MAYCREIINEGRSVQFPATKPRVKPNRAEVPHIVVVGGGVAGIILATRLGRLLGRRGRARVSLIDRSWIHVWKPMLHTFAAGTWNIYQQQVQFVTHARMHHFEYIPGQLDAIDRTTRRIRLAPLQAEGEVVAGPRQLAYDVLVLAFGSRANDFGTPGVVEHCHFIDSQDQADAFNARLRAHVVRSFAQGDNIDIAIVGGGATGVELAAELSRMVELAAGYGEAETRQRLRLTLLDLRRTSSAPSRRRSPTWPHPSCTRWASTCALG